MNILNRGFITVTPKQDFWDWANKIDTEFQFSEEDAVEPNVYLITEDFFDEAPLLEQHFKKIFKTHKKYPINTIKNLKIYIQRKSFQKS